MDEATDELTDTLMMLVGEMPSPRAPDATPES
jgi:hypothetical protein